MTLNQLMLIVKARLNLVLITLTVVTIVALITVALLPKSYMAHARLIVDMRSADSVLGSSGLPVTSPAYMNTQADLASSARVIQLAIKQLKLEESAELRELWERRSNEELTYNAWLVEFIRKAIQIIPGKESNTITISTTSPSPEFSALLANGLAKSYIKTAIELNVEPAREYAQIFDQQRQEAREELIKAQTRLSDLQREQGLVVVTDDRMDVENARLNELSSALTQFQAQRADQASRAASAGVDALLQDPANGMVLNNLRTQLQQKQTMLAEASARIGVNHPEYTRLKAEVTALEQSVEEEAARSNASLNAGTRASYGREATVRRAVEEQRLKILKLKENRDAAMALQRDVDAAQKQFELVSNRTSMSEISSRQTTAHAHLITEAAVPTKPSTPHWLVIGLGAALFGSVLGLCVACIAELLDPRVRSAEDLTALDLHMLGIVSTPQRVHTGGGGSASPTYVGLLARMRQALIQST